MAFSLKSKLPFRDVLTLILFFLISINIFYTLHFVVTQGQKGLTYEPRMTIDAANYWQGALAMISSHQFLLTEDTYHSVGMQIILANWMRIFGHENFMSFKLLNVSLFIFSLFMFYRILISVFHSRNWSLFGVFLMSSSSDLYSYCGIIQYEIIGTSLISLLIFLNLKSSYKVDFLSGSTIAFIAILRAHFSFLIVFVVLFHWLRPDPMKSRKAIFCLLGFMAVAIPFNIYYSVHSHSIFFFQSKMDLQILRALNANSRGFNFPHPEIVEPSGFHFILQNPSGYMNLLGLRVLYFTGLVPDVWFIESNWTYYLQSLTNWETELCRKCFVGISLILLALGSISSYVSVKKNKEWPPVMECLPLFVILILILPNLILNSSTRFLISGIPCFIFMQVKACNWILNIVAFEFRAVAKGESSTW